MGKKFDIIKSYSSRDYCIIMASDEEGVSLLLAETESEFEDVKASVVEGLKDLGMQDHVGTEGDKEILCGVSPFWQCLRTYS